MILNTSQIKSLNALFIFRLIITNECSESYIIWQWILCGFIIEQVNYCSPESHVVLSYYFMFQYNVFQYSTITVYFVTARQIHRRYRICTNIANTDCNIISNRPKYGDTEANVDFYPRGWFNIKLNKKDFAQKKKKTRKYRDYRMCSVTKSTRYHYRTRVRF